MNYSSSIPNSGTSVGLFNFYDNFIYNASTTQLTLTGLTPGAYYEVRLYMRTYGAITDNRVQTFSSTIGNSPAPIATQIGSSYNVDEDNPASTTTSGGVIFNSAGWLALVNNNGGFATGGTNGTNGVNGWAMDVTYQADPTGKITIQAIAQDQADSRSTSTASRTRSSRPAIPASSACPAPVSSSPAPPRSISAAPAPRSARSPFRPVRTSPCRTAPDSPSTASPRSA